jgi:hypothetical protein
MYQQIAMASRPLPINLSEYNIVADSCSLTFDIPRIWLLQVKREISGPDGVEVTYNWAAALDSAEDHALKATLINTIPG